MCTLFVEVGACICMGLVAACAGTDSGHSKTVCPASRALKGVSATLGECHNPHDFPTYTKAMKGCFWRQIRGQSALGCAQTCLLSHCPWLACNQSGMDLSD